MANAVEFVIKAKDEASAALQRVTGSVTDLRGVFSSLVTGGGPVGMAVAAFTAVSGAALIAASTFSDTVEQLDKLSSKTGVGIERLQIMQRIIKDSGGDADVLNMAFVNLNRSITTSDPLLKQLGITSKDTFGAFIQLSDAFSRSDDTAKKTEIAMRLLGKAGADLIGLMPDIADKFDETGKQMRATGELIGDGPDGMAAKARMLDNQMDQLSNNWSGFMTRMQAATVPAVNVMVREFNRMWDSATGNTSAAKDNQYQMERLQEQIDSNVKDMQRMQSQISSGKATGGAAETLKTFIKDRQDLIAKLELQLGKLKGVRAETEDEEQALLEGFGKGSKPAGPDVVASVNLDNKKDVKTARQKRIEELQAVLHTTRAAAEAVLNTLEAIDLEKKKADIGEALVKAGKVPALTNGGPSGVMIPEPDQPAIPVLDVSDQLKNVDAASTFTKTKIKEIGEEWGKTLGNIEDSNEIFKSALQGTFDSLQAGFTAAFGTVLSKGHTLQEGMRAIFDSIVNYALQKLAELAAAKVFELILTLMGIPFAGIVAKGAAGAIDTPLPTDITPVGTATAFANPVGAGMSSAMPTVNIYALDRSGIEASMRDPNGSFGAAMRNASYAGAY